MAVALYARVSTTKQAEKELSIPDQLKQMRDYCALRGWLIAHEYVEAGASATSDRRPVFQEMIGEACQKPSPFEAIVVHSQSRFFRDAIEFGLYERRLRKAGVKLVSITQDVGEDAAGRLARSMFSVFDEYQSAETSKHVLRSMKENARQGFWNGSTIPFGYRALDLPGKGRSGPKRKLVIDPLEAEQVKLIFALYTGEHPEALLGIKGVATYLNKRGLRRRDGKLWTGTLVAVVLQNETYRGEFIFNRRCAKTREEKPESEWVRVEVEPIISGATWERASATRAHRRPDVIAPRRLSSPTLLTGILKCGECGAGMVVATGKGGRYRYYKCVAKHTKGVHLCKSSSIPMEKLNQLVIESLTKRVVEPGNLRRLLTKLSERVRAANDQNKEQLQTLRNELDENHSSANRLFEAVEKGYLEADELLQERNHKLRARRQELLLHIGRLTNQQSMPVGEISTRKAEKVSAALSKVLLDQQSPLHKRYVQALVGEITAKGQRIEIRGPESALADAYAQNSSKHAEWVPSCDVDWCARRESNPQPAV